MLRLGLSAATCLFAATVVWHTFAFLAQHHPALPLFDGWAPWSDLEAVLHGRTTPFCALVGRHNEHRVLLARLVFLIDLLDGGRDRIGTAASLAAQALQAALWVALLRPAGVDRPTRWLVGGAILGRDLLGPQSGAAMSPRRGERPIHSCERTITSAHPQGSGGSNRDARTSLTNAAGVRPQRRWKRRLKRAALA